MTDVVLFIGQISQELDEHKIAFRSGEGEVSFVDERGLTVNFSHPDLIADATEEHVVKVAAGSKRPGEESWTTMLNQSVPVGEEVEVTACGFHLVVHHNKES
jgi:hypothetical protein